MTVFFIFKQLLKASRTLHRLILLLHRQLVIGLLQMVQFQSTKELSYEKVNQTINPANSLFNKL